MKQHQLPMVFQGENVECGLAVLVMILSYYGYHLRLTEMRNTHTVNLSGMSLSMLISIARYYHLLARVVRVESHQLNQLKLPAILHWDMNHFVVLKEMKGERFIIHDPGKGALSLSKRALMDSFTGIAVECYPDKLFQPQLPKKLLSFTELIVFFKPAKKMLLHLMLFTLLYQLFLLLAPRYFTIVIDQVIPANNVSLLASVTIGYLFLRLMIAVTRFLKSCCLARLDNEITLLIGSRMMQSLMRQPLAYFAKRQLSDLLYRFNMIEQIRQLITGGLIEGGWSVFLGIFTLIMMLYLSPLLAMISLVFAVLLFSIKMILARKQQLLTAETLAAKSLEQGCLIETLRGIQPVKIFAKEAERSSLWLNRYVAFLNASSRAVFVKGVGECIRELFVGCEFILILSVAAMLAIHRQISLGVIYAYIFYRQQFSDAVMIVGDKWHDMRVLQLYKERLQDIIDSSPCAPLQTYQLPDKFVLHAENLAYRITDQDPFLFSNLSFVVNAGEKVAITGKSGVGKSTLLKILMGILTPSHGAVKLAGCDIQQMANRHYCISSVMQDDYLLGGSIAQNISFFSPSPVIDKIYHCASLAGILDDILRMPMQFETLVGDMGVALSGGQRQRILLARALYADPKILFLDEATSQIDVATEENINHALKTLNITCIMIAHREETIRRADRIIKL